MRADNINIVSFLIVLGLMYLGAVRHWWNLRKNKRTSVSLWTYLIFGDKKKQGAKIGAILIAALTTSAAGIGDWVNPHIIWQIFVNTGNFSPATILIAIGYVMAGYTIDSDSNNMKVKS